MILRQAMAGMLWSKQFYHYDVEEWLDGDPAGPVPPPSRLSGRNAGWVHLNNRDIISMPDTWEYPWYASWDLAFHCISLAHLDPAFAKDQLLLLCRAWYMHPNGQLPAYEWSFSDVNPPVHALAALRVFEIDGGHDFDFLERILHKLLMNFTWWVNRKDADGNNVFEGGFLGLDNIGPIDRSAHLPNNGRLEQSDGTSWMAMFCLDLLEMRRPAGRAGPARTPTSPRSSSSTSPTSRRPCTSAGCGTRPTASTTTCCRCRGPTRCPLRVRSMVGLLPMCATAAARASAIEHMPEFAYRMRWFMENKPQYAERVSRRNVDARHRGIPAVDRRAEPARADARTACSTPTSSSRPSASGRCRSTTSTTPSPCARRRRGHVDYEPAESRSGLFGGNSNWRGPVWFPVNYLLIQALTRFGQYLGGTTRRAPGPLRHQAHPRARWPTISATASSTSSAPTPTATARRSAATARIAAKGWQDQLLFYEYFDGDTGAGLGASHQTGWTGLVADLVLRKYGADVPHERHHLRQPGGRRRHGVRRARSSSTGSAAVRVPVAVIEILLGRADRPRRPRVGRGGRAGAGAGPPRVGLRAVPRRLRARPPPGAGPAAARRRTRLPVRARRLRRRGRRARSLRPGRQRRSSPRSCCRRRRSHSSRRCCARRAAVDRTRPAHDDVRVRVRVRRRGVAVVAVHQGDGQHLGAPGTGRRLPRRDRRDRARGGPR